MIKAVNENTKKKLKFLVEREESAGKKLFLTAIVQLLFSFMVLFFQPLESFTSNRNDLVYGISDLLPWLLLVSVIYLILSIILLNFLPGKIFDMALSICFGVSSCIYLQGNVLNRGMGTLNGESIAWQNNKRQAIVGLLVWLILLVIPFVVRYFNRNIWRKLLVSVSGLLLSIQVIALVTMLLTTDYQNEDNTGYLSKDQMFTLSEKDNIVVFVLDSFDDAYLDAAMENDETLLDELSGFTYFHNNVGTYGNTYPSITYLLTGEKYYFDETLSEYKEHAFQNADFLQTLHDNQYDSRVFTEEISMAKASGSVVDNHVSGKGSLSGKGIIKGIYNLIAYRDAPFAMKAMFWFYTSDMNQWANAGDDFSPYMISDSYFYKDLQEQGITLQGEKNCFRFYHLQGAHTPYVLNENADYIPAGTDRNRQIEGVFLIVDDYLQKMKDLGIYKDATILITADHGDIGRGECPILFVKPSGKDQGEVKESSAPTQDCDYQATLLKSAGLPYENLGESVFDIKANQSRERIKFGKINTTSRDFKSVPEFSIGTDAHDLDEWVETGKNYEMKHSFYKID